MGLLSGWDDAALLFAALAALYLVECLAWTSTTATAFSSWTGSAGTWREVGAALPVGAGRLFAAAPLPVGRLVVCGDLPIVVGPRGVGRRFDWDADASMHDSASACFVSFDDIRSVESIGAAVVINGQPLGVAACAPVASVAVELVLAALAVPSEEREAEILQQLSRKFDVQAVIERWDALKPSTRLAAGASSLLFAWTFLVGPTAVYAARTLDSGPTWMAVYFAGLTACWSAAVWSARRLAYALGQPGVAAWGRFIVSPAALMRSADVVLRDALAAWHPLAVALAVCSREEAVRLVRRELRERQHPTAIDDGGQSQVERETRRWFASTIARLVESAAVNACLTTEELFDPPVPDGDDARSFCPRCESQFTHADGSCPVCGGVPLQPFLTPVESGGAGCDGTRNNTVVPVGPM